MFSIGELRDRQAHPAEVLGEDRREPQAEVGLLGRQVEHAHARGGQRVGQAGDDDGPQVLAHLLGPELRVGADQLGEQLGDR